VLQYFYVFNVLHNIKYDEIMELTRAKQLALDLMHRHNLIVSGWVFIFDNAKTRVGYCRYKKKTISLSRHFVPMLPPDEVKDTILHEIAHAFTGRKNGHNHVWKQKALEIGCNAQRLYLGEARLKPKYNGTCPGCGRVILRHRRTKISCGKCGNGWFNEKYLYIWTLNN
jgi:ribosomal protein S27AE